MDNGASSYRRFLEGDEDAFGEIIDLYRENLIFFINRYVHDLSVAEDLSEDAFVELLIHKHRYNFKTSFKTYLFSIGRHKALDHIRKASKRSYVPLEDAENTAQFSDDLEEHVLLGERKRLINDAIERLNPDYRTILHLLYLEDMSSEDVGRIMKKNRKQVENLAYRAKNALKNALEKEGVKP